ncbi:hypothetical protein [Lutibacter sp.]
MLRRIVHIGVAGIIGTFINYSIANSNPPDGSVDIQAEVVQKCKIKSGYENLVVNFNYDITKTSGYEQKTQELLFNCVKGTTWIITLDSMNEINGEYYLIHQNDPNEKIKYSIIPTHNGPTTDQDGSLGDEQVIFTIKVYNGYAQTAGIYSDIVHVHISYQ